MTSNSSGATTLALPKPPYSVMLSDHPRPPETGLLRHAELSEGVFAAHLGTVLDRDYIEVVLC